MLVVPAVFVFFMLSMLIYFALFLDSVNVMRNMKSISFSTFPFLS